MSRTRNFFAVEPGGWETGQRAFTLLELLVTIGIIGLLASLLLPVLGKARARGQGISCLSNQKQLMLACLLYTDDFEDRFPRNLGEDETRRVVAEKNYINWVNNVMSWELDSDNTNTALILAGGLGPYCDGAVGMFRCPSDRVVSDVQRNAGWHERVRSVSMNAMVGDAGRFTLSGKNVNNPAYRQFFTLSQIPDPAQIFVFIEEHPDSINDGYFLNNPYREEWNDLPASYHDGAANLSFADGHVETHRWRQASTKPPALPDAAGLPKPVSEDEEEDFYWLMQHTSLRRGYYTAFP